MKSKTLNIQDSDPVEENDCSICIHKIKFPIAVVNGCGHEYCYTCLYD